MALRADPFLPRLVRQGTSSAALPVAAVLVPLSILLLVGWLSWRTVWDDAQAEMRRAADSVAEYGMRTLESYRLAAARANERLRGLSDAQIRDQEGDLHQSLRRMDSELSQSELTYVVDREGRPLLASNLYPVPRDSSLADRDYFQALSAPNPPDVHISRTFVGRFDGQLLFSVSRRRRDTGNPPQPDGFDGVVLVSVSPHVLADGMRRLLAAPGDRMALVLADGYGLSTTGGMMDQRRPLPQVDAASPFHGVVAGGAPSALYVSRTADPGDAMILAMRRIEGFPVYAVSLRPSRDVLARWWRIMAAQFAFGIPATIGLLLLSLRVRRDQLRLAARNADLRVDHERSTDRLSRAKRFGLVGTFEFDLRSGISLRSPEYLSVHGIPLTATSDSHADWVRRLHPDDRDRAEGYLWHALSEASGLTEYGQTYRIVTSTGDVRWISARGEIIRDEAGRAIMLLGTHVDVTSLRTTELALAESDARLRLAQEAVGIGTFELSRGTRGMIWSRRMIELWGFDPAQGQPEAAEVMARLHPEDRGRVRREVAGALRSGQLRSEFRILRPQPQSGAETIWLLARARMLAVPGGDGERLIGVAYDVTERKQAEAQTTLLAHEVQHRAKNALMVVSALVRMSVATSHQEFVAAVQGRIMALARATTLLGQGHWRGADMQELVAQELAPFIAAGATGRVVLEGPALLLSAEQAQPLCMALHELATNAAKYGALSVPEGRLELRWWHASGQAHLHWRERGGPKLDGPPVRRSFGSRLIQQIFSDQLRGAVEKNWDPEGLTCAIRFPVVGR